jgi:CRP/FNR family cyclic AMP-dependent transcriptional regulator
MIDLKSLESENLPTRNLKAGEVLISQGTKTGLVYLLQYGKVEVLHDDRQLCTVSEPGAIFGELAVILKSNHQATVRAVSDTTFLVVNDFEGLANKHPEISWEVTQLLAKRLIATNEILTAARKRFEALLTDAQGDSPAEKKLKTGVRAAWDQFGELMRTKIADF